MACPKVPIIDYIVRLEVKAHRQTKTLPSVRTFQRLGDHLPVAESKGQTSICLSYFFTTHSAMPVSLSFLYHFLPSSWVLSCARKGTDISCINGTTLLTPPIRPTTIFPSVGGVWKTRVWSMLKDSKFQECSDEGPKEVKRWHRWNTCYSTFRLWNSEQEV